jgi:hypothetical protein
MMAAILPAAVPKTPHKEANPPLRPQKREAKPPIKIIAKPPIKRDIESYTFHGNS